MENKFIVTVNDEEVICQRPDGKTESVRWDELQGVVIETTALGPFGTDLFWILAGEKSGCVIPMGATGEDDLISRFKRLPNFDFQAMIMAMGSTENDRFVCWHRPWAS
jgi:hypothetical protein